jgi:hypothetical protein
MVDTYHSCAIRSLKLELNCRRRQGSSLQIRCFESCREFSINSGSSGWRKLLASLLIYGLVRMLFLRIGRRGILA